MRCPRARPGHQAGPVDLPSTLGPAAARPRRVAPSLTPYLALCNNQGAETLHVPMEHAAHLDRLRDRKRIHELTREVIAEVGVYDVRAFSHRRVLRRLARWLPAEDDDARTTTAELYAALGELGVAHVWRER
jgi:hypothetical protein